MHNFAIGQLLASQNRIGIRSVVGWDRSSRDRLCGIWRNTTLCFGYRGAEAISVSRGESVETIDGVPFALMKSRKGAAV